MSLIKRGDKTHFVELKEVQALINHWFEDEASKVLLHIDIEDVKIVLLKLSDNYWLCYENEINLRFKILFKGFRTYPGVYCNMRE